MEEKKNVTRLSRRQFLVGAGQGVVGLAILVSCAPAAPPAPATGGEEGEAPAQAAATIRFLAWGDPADIQAWEQMKALYEERNPNITIEVTPVADPNGPGSEVSPSGGVERRVAELGREGGLGIDHQVGC
jgi:hypothetical protein